MVTPADRQAMLARLRQLPDAAEAAVRGLSDTQLDTPCGEGEWTVRQVVQDCRYEVYDDQCDYTVPEWQIVDTVKLSGSDLNPRWPEPQLNANQRAGGRQEVYEIIFNNDGKKYTYQTRDAAEYAQFLVGSRWTLKVNTFGSVTDIQPAH